MRSFVSLFAKFYKPSQVFIIGFWQLRATPLFLMTFLPILSYYINVGSLKAVAVSSSSNATALSVVTWVSIGFVLLGLC